MGSIKFVIHVKEKTDDNNNNNNKKVTGEVQEEDRDPPTEVAQKIENPEETPEAAALQIGKSPEGEQPQQQDQEQQVMAAYITNMEELRGPTVEEAGCMVVGEVGNAVYALYESIQDLSSAVVNNTVLFDINDALMDDRTRNLKARSQRIQKLDDELKALRYTNEILEMNNVCESNWGLE